MFFVKVAGFEPAKYSYIFLVNIGKLIPQPCKIYTIIFFSVSHFATPLNFNLPNPCHREAYRSLTLLTKVTLGLCIVIRPKRPCPSTYTIHLSLVKQVNYFFFIVLTLVVGLTPAI